MVERSPTRRPLSLTRRGALCLGAGLITSGAANDALASSPSAGTLIVSHPSGLEHDMGAGRPDRPERLRAISTILERDEFAALRRAPAPVASHDAILRAHAPSHLALLEKTTPAEGLASLGADIVMSPGSLAAAFHAAGGAVFAVDEVMAGRARNAFVATRPPGHHATSVTPMGFCLFDNAAIAARHALAAHGAERVAVVDFDVHHGNGVQEIFWSQKNVLYCSTHQAPLYPGTGDKSECGEHGNIVNAPLRKGDGGAAFADAWRNEILPRVDAFRPDVIIVCAGFDAHLHDPLGGLRLQAQDFLDVTRRIMEIAERRSGGRIVSLLEGGYEPEALARCVAAHVSALMGA